MLPKKKRISKKEFPRVLLRGKIFHTPLFSLRFARMAEEAPSKFSFVVSHKTAPKAVMRNKLRRRGYGIIRKQYAHIAPGYYCVFFLKKESHSASFAFLEKEIVSALSRNNILHA